MTDLLECTKREFQRRKGRFLSGTLGFLLAVAMVVVLLHFLRMSKEAEAAVIEKTGTNFMGFVPELVGSDTKTITYRSIHDDPNEDFIVNTILSRPMPISKVAEVKKFPMVKDASPLLFFRLHNAEKSNYFSIGGFEEGNLLAVGETCCAPTDIVSGEFLKVGAVKPGVLLEENYAQSWQMKVGDTLTIGKDQFPVRGIINTGTHPAKADVYMFFRDAERLINAAIKVPLASEANIILVQINNARLQDEAMKLTKDLLKGGVITTYSCFRPAATVAGINERAIWMLNLLAILGAIFLALKAQITTIIERRRDIGILKAIGWTNRHIVEQILMESLIQALVGGILGCLGGIVLFYVAPIVWLPGGGMIGRAISPLICVGGMGIALLGGFFAGIIPGYMAAQASPAEALRR